ncbi:hypothetical protein E1B28_004099 [Marasmius oreades]|uniref:Uncharacterized protein n=1 Tax=Marasmius oreades TaxID=181124 RepID=A0A9P7UXX5_9AGAR|nr:uncharacterized protein E1B28_004099 [Marasmius oreades]KAG7096685.1 hypothetical protein E1B28_004099 [Marasmius oreades]
MSGVLTSIPNKSQFYIFAVFTTTAALDLTPFHDQRVVFDMLALAMSSLFAALIFVYLFMPALWRAITSADDCDVHQASLAVVAARNPVRETGPPANMAKLILLRHKIQIANRKRRNSSVTRPYVVPICSSPSRPPKAPWLRFGRPFTGRQNH